MTVPSRQNEHREMKPLTTIPYKFAIKCEFCQRQNALPDCRLCQGCGDAIVRLMSVSGLEMVPDPQESKRVRQAHHEKVLARVFWTFGD
jgi:hypothetical protein